MENTIEPTTEFQRINNVKGWGVDADPQDRPSFPYWKPAELGTGAHWDHTPQQPGFNDYHSLERPKETATFGARVPPRGFSGLMRRYAFKNFSENMMRHWLILLAADRVDMVEGILSDLAHGHIPNLYKEMGLKSELKYNKKGLAKKSAVLLFGVGLPLSMFFLFRSTEREQPKPIQGTL